MKINLHIERLVLDGLPIERKDGDAVKTAVEAELARLLNEGGVSGELAQGAAVPVVNGGQIKIGGSDPKLTGRQIARAVYRGIGR